MRGPDTCEETGLTDPAAQDPLPPLEERRWGGVPRRPRFSTSWSALDTPLPGKGRAGVPSTTRPRLSAAQSPALPAVLPWAGPATWERLLPRRKAGLPRLTQRHLPVRARAAMGCALTTRWGPCAGRLFPLRFPEVGILLPRGWHSPPGTHLGPLSEGSQPGIPRSPQGKDRRHSDAPLSWGPVRAGHRNAS